MDPREEFATMNAGLHSRAQREIPDEVIDDTKKFAELADAGKPIPFVALRRWLREQRSYTISRGGAEKLCAQLGVPAWWK